MAFERGITQDQMMHLRKHSVTVVGSFSMDGIFENVFALVGKQAVLT